jgi:hypothetical protein
MVAPTGVKNVQQVASQGYRRCLIKQEGQMRKERREKMIVFFLVFL